MNFEDIEQKTLLYLQQANNPLVRIDVLHQHLSNDLPKDLMSLQDFLEFLNQHELFRVINPLPMEENPGMKDVFDEAGFASEPCVLLDTRIPTSEQTYGMMLSQLSTLNNALGLAMREARDNNDTARVHAIKMAIERSVKLNERVEAALRADLN
ncbi:MAG: hypothetical protein COA73_03250 [Candidatus Hydrogenedentota bacterium]|nr:MAG: hypothetical protein COA73_03250 [Candidatus Hydrogenedentota bacterium]